MSTTIYCAYRLKRGVNFWKFVRGVKEQATENVKKELRNFYSSLAASARTDSEDYQKMLEFHEGNEQRARLDFARDTCRKLYKENYAGWERSIFDFTVQLRFYEYKKRIYLIPRVEEISPLSEVFNFLQADNRVEDFSYWNNSDDQLETISLREWHHRRDVWYGIDAGKWAGVEIRVCDFYHYFDVDPWLDMVRELAEAEKKEKTKRKNPLTTKKKRDRHQTSGKMPVGSDAGN
jgi:hypothetical protein